METCILATYQAMTRGSRESESNTNGSARITMVEVVLNHNQARPPRLVVRLTRITNDKP
jgi:hypothetical protein